MRALMCDYVLLPLQVRIDVLRSGTYLMKYNQRDGRCALR